MDTFRQKYSLLILRAYAAMSSTKHEHQLRVCRANHHQIEAIKEKKIQNNSTESQRLCREIKANCVKVEMARARFHGNENVFAAIAHTQFPKIRKPTGSSPKRQTGIRRIIPSSNEDPIPSNVVRLLWCVAEIECGVNVINAMASRILLFHFIGWSDEPKKRKAFDSTNIRNKNDDTTVFCEFSHKNTSTQMGI